MKKRWIIATVSVLLIAVTTMITSSSSSLAVESIYSDKPCDYHSVVDSLCTRCHPELVSMFKERADWCNEHKMPESQCYLCNPNLKHAQTESKPDPETAAATQIDWCAEHRVPESECTKCKPDLAAVFKEKGDWCGGHGVPESHCYLCNPTLKFPQEEQYQLQQERLKAKSADKPKTSLYRPNSTHCTTDDAMIQLASIETAKRAGLTIETVEETSESATLEAPAEVEFDATESYAVTSLLEGTLVRWTVQPGEEVRQGQILAYIESLDAADLKAEYVHAAAILSLSKSTYDREKSLSESGMTSLKEMQEANADYLRAQADQRKAASALRASGFSDDDLARLETDNDFDVTMPIRAHHAGTLVEQKSDLGAIISAGESIGLIAQTKQLWVEAQVRERELPRVQVGQSVLISSDGDGLNRCSGSVSWVASAVDPLTRMGRVRIQIEQNESELRAHQFVNVQVSTHQTLDDVVMVPSQAVQWDGCCNIVFVSETPDRFKPTKVHVQFSNGTSYAVTGLKPNDKIVAGGSYLLKTELMKSSLGAGCCGTGA